MLCIVATAEGAGIALEPHHSGSDYTFTGSYSDGHIIITSQGIYYLIDNLVTSSPDYAIAIESPGVILDGNYHKISGPGTGSGVLISKNGVQSTVTNISTISEFDYGINSFADNVTIAECRVSNNTMIGIDSNGNYSTIIRNTAINHRDYGLCSRGHNSSVIENTVLNNRGGILSQGNYAYVYGNTVVYNTRRGISAGGTYVGPEPGDNGSGYYARVENNQVLVNDERGITNFLPHAIIKGNLVYGTNNTGIELYYASSNASVSDNRLISNNVGLKLSDSAQNIKIHQNLFNDSKTTDFLIDAGNGKGNGTIFDNYLGSLVPVNGTGNYGRYVWSNPAGPEPGLNFMGGPFIAGNYWSNPSHTGWSDLQPPAKDGYTTIPYEVVSGSGIYDTIPLVRVLPFPEVLNISPSSALAGSTITYQLTGNNFIDGALVNFTHLGESNLTSVGSLSGIDLTGSLFIPSSSVTGPWNVSVNQNGLYSNDNVQFIINPALPKITNLNPGGAIQNTHSAPFPVIITGTGFDTVSDSGGVTVDGSAISYTIESPTRINALFPETIDNILGNHPVIVTGISGPSVPYNFVVSGTGFTIDASSDEIGWISPSGMFSAYPGESITFQFKPTAGARIKNLTVNGVEQSTESPFVIPSVDRDYAIRLNNEPLSGVIIAAFTVESVDGYTLTFRDNSWGEINQWKWDFGDGSFGTGNVVSHTYSTPGSYSVSLWARNSLSQSQVIGDITIPLTNDQSSPLFFKS